MCEWLTINSPVSFVSMHWSGACRVLQERISCEIRERLSSQNCAEDADKEQVGSNSSVINET